MEAGPSGLAQVNSQGPSSDDWFVVSFLLGPVLLLVGAVAVDWF
jgi:hypothetical protein